MSEVGAIVFDGDRGRVSTGGTKMVHLVQVKSAIIDEVVGVERSVGIRELRDNLSKFLDQVKGGDEVIITEHGKPVAKVTSLDAGNLRLQQLIAEGRVAASKRPKDGWLPKPMQWHGSGSSAEFLERGRDL